MNDIKNLPESLSKIYLPLKGTILYNLGLHLYIFGRYNECVSLFEEALKIRRGLDDKLPSHLQSTATADCLNGLGISYHKLAVKSRNDSTFLKSEELLKESIEIYEQLDSEVITLYKVNVANPLSALGYLYTDMKRCSEALEVHLRALKIRNSQTGKDDEIYRSAIVESLNNIAIALHCLNRWKDSESYLLEALELSNKLIINSRHTHLVQVAMIHANLGITYQGMKLCEKAEKNFIECIKMFHEAVNKISPVHRNDVKKGLHFLYRTYIDCWNLTPDKAKKEVDALAKDLH